MTSDRQPCEHTPPRIETRVLRSASAGRPRPDGQRYVTFCIVSLTRDWSLIPPLSPPFNHLKKNADVSVEQVALLAQQNTLPEPTLDISMLSYSTGPPQSLAAAAYSNSAQPSVTRSGSNSSSSAAVLRSTSAAVVPVAPPPPADDPWMTGPRPPFGAAGINGGGAAPPSSVAGTGLPAGWWKKLDKVTVQFAGQQGFVLNRYMVYGITTEVRRHPRLATLPDFCPLICVRLFARAVVG